MADVPDDGGWYEGWYEGENRQINLSLGNFIKNRYIKTVTQPFVKNGKNKACMARFVNGKLKRGTCKKNPRVRKMVRKAAKVCGYALRTGKGKGKKMF